MMSKPRNQQSPLLLRFSERLPECVTLLDIRYDISRQISEVFTGGSWIEVADTTRELAATRLTEVGRETTDDQ